MEEKIHIYSDESNHDKSITNKENNINIDNEGLSREYVRSFLMIKTSCLDDAENKLNNLENKFKIINENILNLEKIYEKNSFDAIVTNPPYKKENTGILNDEKKKLISRHEILAKLEDFIKISNKLLKDKGEFYMVHRPERLVDILYFMRKYKIEPKEIRFIYSHINDASKMVLIKGVKNGKAFLKFRENLYIYNEDGKYTDEIFKIYGKEK